MVKQLDQLDGHSNDKRIQLCICCSFGLVYHHLKFVRAGDRLRYMQVVDTTNRIDILDSALPQQ